MSIIYCEKHDLRWDSDFAEVCPRCEIEADADEYLAGSFPTAPNTASQVNAEAHPPCTGASVPAAAVPDDPVAVKNVSDAWQRSLLASLTVSDFENRCGPLEPSPLNSYYRSVLQAVIFDCITSTLPALAAHYLHKAPEGYALVPLARLRELLLTEIRCTEQYGMPDDEATAEAALAAIIAAAKQEADRG